MNHTLRCLLLLKIVETSGVGEAEPLANALAAAGFRLESVITVVDAEAGASALQDQEVARQQIKAADVVVVSKCDLMSDAFKLGDVCDLEDSIRALLPSARVVRARFGQCKGSQCKCDLMSDAFNLGDVCDLEDSIRALLPSARVVRARFGQVPLETILDVEIDDGCAHSSKATASASVKGTIGFLSHESAVEIRPTYKVSPVNGLFRAKGLVRVAERPHARYVLHLSGRQRIECCQDGTWDSAPCTQLVFIGTQLSALHQLRDSLAMLTDQQPLLLGSTAIYGQQARQLAALVAAQRRLRLISPALSPEPLTQGRQPGQGEGAHSFPLKPVNSTNSASAPKATLTTIPTIASAHASTTTPTPPVQTPPHASSSNPVPNSTSAAPVARPASGSTSTVAAGLTTAVVEFSSEASMMYGVNALEVNANIMRCVNAAGSGAFLFGVRKAGLIGSATAMQRADSIETLQFAPPIVLPTSTFLLHTHGASACGPSDHTHTATKPSHLDASACGPSDHTHSTTTKPSHLGASACGPSDHTHSTTTKPSHLGASACGPSDHTHANTTKPSHLGASACGPSDHTHATTTKPSYHDASACGPSDLGTGSAHMDVCSEAPSLHMDVCSEATRLDVAVCSVQQAAAEQGAKRAYSDSYGELWSKISVLTVPVLKKAFQHVHEGCRCDVVKIS
eukprot:gene17955-24359_t